MSSQNRKRRGEIRTLMAETGLTYTQAVRELDRLGVSGFTAQKSSATSSVLVAPRHPRKD
ncbi:hypothetical protein Pph01_78160 [Planotetraspora phitsanulokensis]|uniref:Uncharacterized protein n=1 Tax=Planotetraspora phitsanulokensis TaxID=575192 RepID=A0A8J3XNG9_9ACTN|nr:hypothetical protein Pph01_78160 [Planotetraspora phitsanulokensis]